MNIESLVEAVSAGIGASAVVGESMRRYWRRRERKQQAEFERAVSRIVDAKLKATKNEILQEIRSERIRRNTR